MQTANDNAPRLISLNGVCEISSLSRTAINKLRARGDFPAEVRLGERRVAFVRSEIYDWLQARIDARAQGRRFKISEAA